MYKPDPIDTSDVILDEEIIKLTDALAKNTHDVWAVGRIRDGWVYGKNRNDETKEHPCLVPYEELPEAEKEYDRSTALETVKVILKLGYSIEKK